METDGSPTHCIIYKYGFLHVSITLHCEQVLICVCALCVFVHMPTLFLLPLCVWDQVCPHPVILWVCSCFTVFVFSLAACSCFYCVYVYERVSTHLRVCMCLCVWYTYTAHFPGGILLLLSSVQMKILFIIDKTSLPLSEPILLTFLEYSTVKSSCWTPLFIFSWTACLSSWLVAKSHKFLFSTTNRWCVVSETSREDFSRII